MEIGNIFILYRLRKPSSCPWRPGAASIVEEKAAEQQKEYRLGINSPSSMLQLLCLTMILKLFQCCTIVGSPFCPILSIFRQLDVLFCLLYEYLLFFTVDVLCSLSEAISVAYKTPPRFKIK